MRKLLGRLGSSRRTRRGPLRAHSRPCTFEMLEDRQFLSLVIDLALANGATTAAVTSVGQQVQMNVYAVVTGQNNTGSDDGMDLAIGSFISAATTGVGAAGNLSAQFLAPFNANGAQQGKIQDLNGDGNLDVGAATTTNTGDYFAVRAAGMNIESGTVSGPSNKFLIGTLTYTVTAVNDGKTSISFIPRLPDGAVWQEDGNVVNSAQSGTVYAGGTPFVITSGSANPVPGVPPTSPPGTLPPTITLSHGKLAIVGTTTNDAIRLTASKGKINVTINSTLTKSFKAVSVKGISINALAGNDSIIVGKGIRGCIINGGDGNDSIIGGDGNDTITGGAGNNVIRAGGGDDLINAKNGLKDNVDGGGGFNRAVLDKIDKRTHIQQLLKRMPK